MCALSSAFQIILEVYLMWYDCARLLHSCVCGLVICVGTQPRRWSICVLSWTEFLWDGNVLGVKPKQLLLWLSGLCTSATIYNDGWDQVRTCTTCLFQLVSSCTILHLLCRMNPVGSTKIGFVRGEVLKDIFRMTLLGNLWYSSPAYIHCRLLCHCRGGSC